MDRCRHSLAVVIALGFLLGSFKGYLALWEEDKAEPVQIFPCPVDSLPEADQTALEEGIHARSRIELDQFLEDYLS